MQKDQFSLAYVFSGCLFAAVFLAGALVYGGPVTRSLAMATALVACMSQFTAQDPVAYRVSIMLAYGAFVASILTLIFFARGL